MKQCLIVLLAFLLFAGLGAETIATGGETFGVNVVSSDPDRTVLHLTVDQFDRQSVTIDGAEYFALALAGEPLTLTEGAPELPKVVRSLVIGDDAAVTVNVIDNQYIDLPMAVAPSKGNLVRTVNPADVPYNFGSVYLRDEFYPGQAAELGHPYILRDLRGIAVNLYPFQYNPVSGVLRVTTSMTVEIVRTGVSDENVKVRRHNEMNTYFNEIYRHRFLNLPQTRYESLEEDGHMLIVSPANYIETLSPWVQWKTQKGMTVEVVDVANIGTTAQTIKNYLQTRYNEDPDLVFVVLVGDHAQIPSFTSGSGASDPTYSLLEGTDSYPDIFVGRLSAETVPQLETQVERFVTYERDIVDGDWLHQGMGIASTQGAGQGDDNESDDEHIDNIRTQLLDYTYTTVDQIYEPTATAAQISNGLNEGRSSINYCGHGSNNTWVTTGFSNNHIDALTNDNKLPFINSVACVNGNFANLTCFAEAWMRATNDQTGEPAGAIGIYASSINQTWAPPMSAQDEAVDLLTAEEKFTLGGLWYNSSCLMIDEYNTGGVSMFLTWHIFGDPSLMVRTDTPVAMEIDHLPTLLMGLDTFEVSTGTPGAKVALTLDGEILGVANADESGMAVLQLTNVPDVPTNQLVLTVTAYNKITYQSQIELAPNQGPYVVISAFGVTGQSRMEVPSGYSGTIDLSLRNVGVENAAGVTVGITTDSEWITLSDQTETVGELDADAVASFPEAFGFTVADNAPDYTLVTLHVTITDNNGGNWTADKELTIIAPVLELAAMSIDDVGGNDNGALDPGETGNFSFPITNNGHYETGTFTVTLVSNDPNLHINSPVQTFGSLEPNQTINPFFLIDLDEDADTGNSLIIGVRADYGAFSTIETYLTPVGQLNEDFENGFDLFPWTMDGDADWFIVSNMYHNGSYSIRSGQIGDNQETSLQVQLNIISGSDIVFWRRINTEPQSDVLSFYIDEQLQDSWSGNLNWSEHRFPVTAGLHTFKWTYTKDNLDSSGNDCGWIDQITFPPMGSAPSPIAVMGTTTLDFGSIDLGESVTREFEISNYGDVDLVGSIEFMSGFLFQEQLTQVHGNNQRPRDERDQVEFTIPGHGSRTFTVTFNPQEALIYDGVFTIVTNDVFLGTTTITVTARVNGAGTEPGTTPFTTAFNGAFPNPFNPRTTLSFSLAEDQPVELGVYNVRGQLVKTLVDERLSAGQHEVVWDGHDDNGRQVSSGVYFSKFKGSRYTSLKKMILLK